MSVCGIDFSSKCVDIVLLDDDTDQATWHRIPLHYLAGQPDAALMAARSVRPSMMSRSWWDDHGVYLVGIEAPRGRQLKACAALYRVQGAILAGLPGSLTVLELPPWEWRQACGLPGNAKKDVVKAWAYIEHGFGDGMPLDATDAYAIAYAARALNEQGIQADMEGAL